MPHDPDPKTEMYDALSQHYDRFVNWPARLAGEMPFIVGQMKPLAGDAPSSVRVLDAACGTGRHAIALAEQGYRAAGADLSPRMIARARENAQAALGPLAEAVQFEAAGFGQLAQTFAEQFDALLCLGNSLPHVLEPEGLAAALADFAACLRPGGLLLVQNRNFDAVLQKRQRWMEPQAHREGQDEWLFLRFYDFDPDRLITFNMIVLHRQAEAPWQQEVIVTRLRPLTQDMMTSALRTAGFEQIETYGSLGGERFDPKTSGNLVVAARLMPVD